jgi:branched-chain amino acid transport system substrate-binding protein
MIEDAEFKHGLAFHHMAVGQVGSGDASLTRASGLGYRLQNYTKTWEEGMNKIARLLFAAAAVGALSLSAQAADTIKVGLILPYSGQFADGAAQQDNAVKLYMKQHGDTVAGKKIEIIRKDTGGINPAVAKRLAEELITRDNVDIITGFLLTPNAMAGGDVSNQAKKFMVVMNAATAIITTKSPYMARTSLTIPQLNQAFGSWAVKNAGVKKAYTMVSDYGPGHDAEQSFQAGFKQAGGEIVGSVRMAVANPDFSAYVQRAKDLNPEAIYVFIPGGAQPGALGKALAERGIDTKKTKLMGQGELTDEHALASMGDAALGILTTFHYNYTHKSKMNEAFVKSYNAEFKRNPDFFSVGAWDAMHLIYEAVKKTKGNTDGEALINAAKGMKWESPRGPISIDPETRDIIQTVYIWEVKKVNGKLENVEVAKIENVKDPVKEAMKQKK